MSKKVKNTVKRKFNYVTKQTLITSVFSPKNGRIKHIMQGLAIQAQIERKNNEFRTSLRTL